MLAVGLDPYAGTDAHNPLHGQTTKIFRIKGRGKKYDLWQMAMTINFDEFEALLQRLKQDYPRLEWHAHSPDFAPEVVDVDIKVPDRPDIYISIPPTGEVCAIVNDFVFEKVDAADTLNFITSLLAGRFEVQTKGRIWRIKRMRIIGDRKEWLS